MGKFLNKIWKIKWVMLHGAMNIRQRLLLLLLGCSLVSAIVFASFSVYGLMYVRRDVSDMGARRSEAGAEYTKQYINKTSKDTLAELARAEASYIDREMALMRHDVLILSESLTWMKKHPDKYLPGSVMDPYKGKVPPAEPYIIYSPELRKRGIETVEREVALVSNVRDTLVPMEKTYGDTIYSASYFGSEEGFLICSSIFPGDKYSPISDDENFDYDPRIRPWYINAVTANKEVFSLPYITILTEDHSDIEVISCSAPYYDSTGIAGVASLDIATSRLRQFISDTVLGQKGINFVMSDKGKIVFSSVKEGLLTETDSLQDLRNTEVPELAEAAAKMINGERDIMPMEIGGEKYVLAFAPIPTVGWSLGVLVTQDDLSSSIQESQTYFIGQMNDFEANLYDRYNFLWKMAVVALILLLAAVTFMSDSLSSRFVKPIRQMADGVRDIASGNLDKKLDIRTGDELEHLAVCFNAMTDELKRYMENLTNATAEKERIATELSLAKNIQQGALPQDFFEDKKGFKIFATMDAAKQIGGDFYDFYMLDDNHLVVTIADVSGKGVPAALFMMRAKTILKNLALMAQSPDDFGPVMTLANRELCQDNEEMMFVTVFIAQIDLSTGEVIYVNGGHNPPLARQGGRFTYLQQPKNSRLVLGVNEFASFEAQRMTLAAGDMLFLYTDGVTEAINKDEELYSEERLEQTLNGMKNETNVREILANVRRDIDDYADGTEQYDDITMLGLMYCPEDTPVT